jgi:hypothetical protein
LKQVDPTGRIDILAYRLAERFLLPALEGALCAPGLGRILRPYAEAILAEMLPARPLFTRAQLEAVRAPKPRRRLCT